MKAALLSLALFASTLPSEAQEETGAGELYTALETCVMATAQKYATINAPMSEVIELATSICRNERDAIEQRIGEGRTLAQLDNRIRRRALELIADARLEAN